MSKIFYISLFCFSSVVFTSLEVKAHGGRTDSNGCHNCRTGACAGEYHCHGGGVYKAPQVHTKPTDTPSPKLLPIVNPKTEIQEDKTVNNNIESIDKSKEIQKQDENKKNNSHPADDFVKLVSILGSLGLGYFIYGIFNRS